MGMWEMDGTHLESLGAIPDLIVENTPEDELKEKDRQLERAVDFLMEEAAKSPRNYDYPTPVLPR
jgi:tricorn protease